MKRHFLLFMMAMSFSFAIAQNVVTIKAGTVVTLKATKQVKAAEVNEGDLIDFRTVSDLKIENNIVIPKGTIAKGIVNVAKKSSLAGTKGRLVIDIDRISLPSGDVVYLTDTTVKISGKNRTPLAVVTACFVWPCIFIPGTKAVMPQGYEVEAIVETNTDIKIN